MKTGAARMRERRHGRQEERPAERTRYLFLNLGGGGGEFGIGQHKSTEKPHGGLRLLGNIGG